MGPRLILVRYFAVTGRRAAPLGAMGYGHSMKDPRSGAQERSEPDSCSVCGGDGRIDNAFGQVAKCPSCHGSGRRLEVAGFHDVTKTKPSHHRGGNAAVAAAKSTWPATSAGAQLASEVRDSALSSEVKAKLTREIIEHEDSHGQCTQTFLKKIRKQFRPAAPAR